MNSPQVLGSVPLLDEGVSAPSLRLINQPLLTLWTDHLNCGDDVIFVWRQTVAIAASEGHTYQSTPLVAVSFD